MKALSRFNRFSQGESIAEIAASDDVSEETVRDSIVDGRRRFEIAAEKKILRLKIEGQLENERLRQKVRARLGEKFLDALGTLLDGKRMVVSRDKETGAIHLEEVVDPAVLFNGVESYARSVSLLERPAQAPTVVNVQQNNTPQQSGGLSFESILAKIREEQKRVGPVFEAEGKEVGSQNQADDKGKNS